LTLSLFTLLDPFNLFVLSYPSVQVLLSLKKLDVVTQSKVVNIVQAKFPLLGRYWYKLFCGFE